MPPLPYVFVPSTHGTVPPRAAVSPQRFVFIPPSSGAVPPRLTATLRRAGVVPPTVTAAHRPPAVPQRPVLFLPPTTLNVQPGGATGTMQASASLLSSAMTSRGSGAIVRDFTQPGGVPETNVRRLAQRAIADANRVLQLPANDPNRSVRSTAHPDIWIIDIPNDAQHPNTRNAPYTALFSFADAGRTQVLRMTRVHDGETESAALTRIQRTTSAAHRREIW